MKLYGIWCKDKNNNRSDWLRQFDSNDEGIIVFQSIRAAQRRAAGLYGFDSYSKMKKADWAEVRLLAEVTQ